MSLLGLKASQAHGILNPYAGGVQRAPEMDEGRMQAMARAVLETLPQEAGTAPVTKPGALPVFDWGGP